MSQYAGFKEVQLSRPQRSTFDLSHEKRLSTRIGKLTPVVMLETMPNDTFYGTTEVLLKMAPMLAPIYHRLNLFIHFFFVPSRLLMDEWEPFITGGRLGEDVSDPPIPPRINIQGVLERGEGLLDLGSVADYLGIPPIPDSAAASWAGRGFDAMPFAAWFKCWYDYYRDRNYVPDDERLPMASGTLPVDFTADLLLRDRYRAWQHDYFTSALPWTQRGAEVLMPIQGSGQVTYKQPTHILRSDLAGPMTDSDQPKTGLAGTSNGELFMNDIPTSTYRQVIVDNIQSVDITNSDISINDLRQAVRLQEWLERNALAGSRYNESIMAHFGRRTSDARLQRAEYIGGGKSVIQIDEVMTTAYSEDADSNLIPPANMSGKGKAYSNVNRFSYNTEEHGFIVGVMSVMPTSSYMQGIPRMFTSRNTFLDYPWPSFAHLGEQEVYNHEIYLSPTSFPVDRTTSPVFGYQSRYSDWKHVHSSTHGDFRDTLKFWHLTRDFASQPNLGEAFVNFEDSLQDRIFAVAEVDTLWCYVYNKINVKRSLPYFGTPQL